MESNTPQSSSHDININVTSLRQLKEGWPIMNSSKYHKQDKLQEGKIVAILGSENQTLLELLSGH